jgi:aspartyl-tRNA(Asn)/glutamyl-tRNA(Gln) amidotransferase subunit C
MIEKNTVEYVANLSRICLDANELDRLSCQLKSILDFIDTLTKADVSAVAPTSHILPIHTVLRKDAAGESLAPAEALANAPQRQGDFFSVPKIIE